MPSVCTACAPHVSGVGPTRSAHGWRPSGVYIHASSSAHSFVHAQKSRRTQRTTTNARRWSSALDARVAHGDAHPANDDAMAKIATFSARRPCVVPVLLALYVITKTRAQITKKIKSLFFYLILWLFDFSAFLFLLAFASSSCLIYKFISKHMRNYARC